MTDSIYLNLLKNRIQLDRVPFTDRDSRLIVFRTDTNTLWVGLAEYETDPWKFPPIKALWFIDEADQSLNCNVTTFPHQLLCQTVSGTYQITFVDRETLLVTLPEGRSGLILHTPLEQTTIDRHGGILQHVGTSPCHLVYTTNATLLGNEVTVLPTGIRKCRLEFEASAGDALLLNITRTATFNRRVPRAAVALAASEQRWHAWFEAVPAVAERYRSHYYYAWWVMGVNLLYPYAHSRREGMVPSKLGYVGVWHWDSYFHALALRHTDMRLAQEQFRIMLDYQQENGLIPDIVHDEGILAHTTEIVEADITKPPLTAWAAWKLYEMDGDREFLNELYDPIVRFQHWWFSESDPDGNGLCEYLHPWSSGLDNSPLWDRGLPVETPDLSAYLCLQYDHLGKITTVLGRDAEASTWHERAGDLAQLMLDLRWDAKEGYFWAAHNGERLAVRTPFNLFPLITGRMPTPVAEQLVATLTDERQFWGRRPVPTVAFNDPAYNPLSMWRGPVWLNVNYLLIDGLQRAGYPEVARELRRRTLALVLEADDFYEYYHPETGEKPPRATYAFGWSAALFIDLALAASAEE